MENGTFHRGGRFCRLNSVRFKIVLAYPMNLRKSRISSSVGSSENLTKFNWSLVGRLKTSETVLQLMPMSRALSVVGLVAYPIMQYPQSLTFLYLKLNQNCLTYVSGTSSLVKIQGDPELSFWATKCSDWIEPFEPLEFLEEEELDAIDTRKRSRKESLALNARERKLQKLCGLRASEVRGLARSHIKTPFLAKNTYLQ
ncbi:hypothetical protein L6452_30877 [Arctium lappa]|uniref:Uncharacterized protein n=1 Tax=Arctium lappa TaxID=4217 RepID=A0ACB8ZNS1_ARCLA|nr:hypothetical protein L6452_30877 [Arctium lappa]